MWETIKKDPLIRTIFVIILGVIGFGLAFNIMFGNSYTLAYAINTLMKIAILALFAIAAVKLHKYIDRKLKDKNSVYHTTIPISLNLKSIMIGLIIVIVVIFALSSSGTFVPSGQAVGYFNIYHMNQGYQFSTFSILAVLAKILMFISGLGVIVGLTTYFINVSKTINYKIVDVNQVNRTEQEKCKNCGMSIYKDWICCPKCGADRQSTDISDVGVISKIMNDKEKELSEEEQKEMKAINEVYNNIHKVNKNKNKKHSNKSS